MLNTTKHRHQQHWPGLVMLEAGKFLAVLLIACLPTLSLSQTLLGKPYSLSGSPQCSDWIEMPAEARFAWTSSFLSTLSMGHETSRRAGRQKFKDMQGIEEVVTAINTYCPGHPDAQASEAAAPFLN